MIHRDLKIGLVLGLVIVAGVVIKLATDPRLSTKARMIHLNDSTDGLESIDSNNISENNILSQTPFSSYPENLYTQNDPWQSQDSIPEDATQNERTDDSALNDTEIIDNSALQNASEQILPPKQEPEELPDTSNNDEQEVVEEPQRFHVVEQGQSLSEISSIYYGSPNKWRKIVDANPDAIKNPDKIKPGMRLIIP